MLSKTRSACKPESKKQKSSEGKKKDPLALVPPYIRRFFKERRLSFPEGNESVRLTPLGRECVEVLIGEKKPKQVSWNIKEGVILIFKDGTCVSVDPIKAPNKS
jgi:hypothetical protein